jgi:hypothetical protein
MLSFVNFPYQAADVFFGTPNHALSDTSEPTPNAAESWPAAFTTTPFELVRTAAAISGCCASSSEKSLFMGATSFIRTSGITGNREKIMSRVSNCL